MTDNLFNQAPAESGQPQVDDSPFSQLVGEGKKFKTPEDLAKGKLEADRFIEQLTKEQAELREELKRFVGIEEKVESLLKAQQAVQSPSTPAPAAPTGPVDQTDINKLVNDALSAREAQNSAASNFKTSQQAVIEANGGNIESARKAIVDRATALGVSVEYMKSQAETSPTAFLALMGMTRTQAPANSDAPRSTHTQVPVNHQGPAPGSKEYFDHLRRTDPTTYYSPAVQNQLHKAVAANPEKWR